MAASLLNRNARLCLLLRDPKKAKTLFGEHKEEKLQVYVVFLINEMGYYYFDFLPFSLVKPIQDMNIFYLKRDFGR